MNKIILLISLCLLLIVVSGCEEEHCNLKKESNMTNGFCQSNCIGMDKWSDECEERCVCNNIDVASVSRNRIISCLSATSKFPEEISVELGCTLELRPHEHRYLYDGDCISGYYDIKNWSVTRAYKLVDCYKELCLPVKDNLTEIHCEGYAISKCEVNLSTDFYDIYYDNFEVGSNVYDYNIYIEIEARGAIR